jgi:DNA invertase Pin-like site-specific DNA recombinase
MSGEGGIRSAISAQLFFNQQDTTQAQKRQAIRRFWSVLVIYGCLALFGIVFSTKAAQFNCVLPPRIVAAAPRGNRRRQDADDRLTVANIAASYARFSSDLQDTSSIDQQQRRCRERAATNGHEIRTEFEFADEAISGKRRDRDGLSAMLEAARAGRFATLYFDCLSRLARELVITLPVLKELVYVCHVRIISVSEGIDSDIAGWELMAIFRGWMHGEYLKALRAAVLRGQEETVLNDFSVGDWCFGYASEPIPGSETTRRGRNGKPRKRYIINEEHARWVRLVFEWFVQERRSLGWIAREMTRLGAPKDHRSKMNWWHHDYVRRVLRNQKYIGIWPWGQRTNVYNPLTGQHWQEYRPIEEAAKWLRELPHLRLIDDDTFLKAQAILDENELKVANRRRASGQLDGSAAGTARPRHLLQGLIKCGSCGHTFGVTCGCRYLRCPAARWGACTSKTNLSRELAACKILQAVSDRILHDEAWRQMVFDEAIAAWESRRQAQPDERKEVDRALAEIDQRVARLLDEIEAGRGGPEVENRLAARRQERQQLLQQRQRFERQEPAEATPPTREWVTEQLQSLHKVLTGGGPAAADALRNLIGSVVVTEMQQPNRRRKHFRGVFRIAVASVLGGRKAAQADDATGEGTASEIAVDFSEPPPWAALADEVKTLFDAAVTFEEIANRLGCRKSWPKKALAWWHQQHGLQCPDGRKVVARLNIPTQAEAGAEQVMALYREGLPMQEIAHRLGWNKDTVTSAVRHWHELRGLPVPDGRNRRKQLNENRRDSRAADGDTPELPAA